MINCIVYFLLAKAKQQPYKLVAFRSDHYNYMTYLLTQLRRTIDWKTAAASSDFVVKKKCKENFSHKYNAIISRFTRSSLIAEVSAHVNSFASNHISSINVMDIRDQPKVNNSTRDSLLYCVLHSFWMKWHFRSGFFFILFLLLLRSLTKGKVFYLCFCTICIREGGGKKGRNTSKRFKNIG